MLLNHNETSYMTAILKWIMGMCLYPIYNVYHGSEWYLLAVLICIIADYRFGRGENRKRYTDAKEAGDKAEMLHYQWRRSHAWRRTLTKMGDYFLIVTVGVFIGHAFLTRLGIPDWWGGMAGTAICCGCELISIFGHFFFLKGIELNPQTLKRTATRFAVSFAKHKDRDIGESLEEALQAPSSSHKMGEPRADEEEQSEHPPNENKVVS